MAKYKSFLHVERLQKEEVEGILNGTCYITPKLDGTNAVIWSDGEKVYAGNRNRELSSVKDNAGFYNWVHSDDDEAINLRELVLQNPELIVYGEWGCGKIAYIKDYNPGTANYFWIFDMYDTEEEHYVKYEIIESVVTYHSLRRYLVPLLAKIENPTVEELYEIAKNNTFLLDNANHPGEGIVIRNYDFRNKWGHYEIAKIVLDEYIQEKKTKKKLAATPGEIEKTIVDIYVTESELSKAVAKTCIQFDSDSFNNKDGKHIGFYLNLVWKDLVEENIMDWLKKYNMPTINFGALREKVNIKAKEYIGL